MRVSTTLGSQQGTRRKSEDNFWHRVGENTVECFGPYVFNQTPESNIAEELLDACIGAVAKTQSVGIINTRPTPEFSRRHFELLGTLDDYAPDGSGARIEAWFRLLREDTGSTVWVHPESDAFVRREYARLVLPREIRIDQPSGETLPRHSVLSAKFDRLQGRVTLRPMWPWVWMRRKISNGMSGLWQARRSSFRNCWCQLQTRTNSLRSGLRQKAPFLRLRRFSPQPSFGCVSSASAKRRPTGQPGRRRSGRAWTARAPPWKGSGPACW